MYDLLINDVRWEVANLNRVILKGNDFLFVLFNSISFNEPEYLDPNEEYEASHQVTATSVVEVDFLVLHILVHNHIVIVYNSLHTGRIG
jgi:hypothetical protein